MNESKNRDRLEQLRRNLLDLGLRNPLLSSPKGKSRIRRIEIVQERSEDIFDLLVNHRAEMAFAPSVGDSAERTSATTPLNPVRLRDRFLQTNLSEEKLDSTLLALYYDAQTMEEEQGVSHLHLAIGFLEWFEAPSSQEGRLAPLLLIPVALDRSSAKMRFTLAAREDDFSGNISLAEKLRTEFGIVIPEVEVVEDFNLTAYYGAIEAAIAIQPRWRVLRNEMRLAFFSFAKFLMHRDLDETSWPLDAPLMARDLVSGFLGETIDSLGPICGENDRVDKVIAPHPIHVTDVDSSQALVIEEVRRGRNLVVQGPPGTGKSQTITNIIANAVADGKTVLFLAEKMAALEVVKSRLDRLELGAVCLELHSKKSNKKAVLHELALTLQVGRPYLRGLERRQEDLADAQRKLDGYIHALATPLAGLAISPREVLAKLISFRNQPLPEGTWSIDGIAKWTNAKLREALDAIVAAASRYEEVGDLTNHPWLGIELERVPVDSDLDSLSMFLDEYEHRLMQLRRELGDFARLFGKSGVKASDAREVNAWLDIARELMKMPEGVGNAIELPIWEDRSEIARMLNVVEAGLRVKTNREALATIVDDEVWNRNLRGVRRDLDQLGRSWFRWFSPRYHKAMREFLECLRGAPPPSLEEKVTLLDRIMATKADESLIEQEGGRVGGAFGSEWRGKDSDWERLGWIAHWRKNIQEHRQKKHILQLRKDWTFSPSASETGERLATALSMLIETIGKIQLKMGMVKPSSDPSNSEKINFENWMEKIAEWRTNLRKLIPYTHWRMAARKCAQLGLHDIISALETRKATADHCQKKLMRIYFEAIWATALRERPCLRELNGSQLSALRATFADLDKKSKSDAVLKVARRHYEGLPNHDSSGEMATIRTEINKKRRHLEIRKLIEKAGRAIQRIKPVFMMSPISVAQYLPRGVVEFDLLVVDEASQMRPEDAMGAIARAKQVVIVGDTRQLPPSSFFMSQAMGDETDVDEDSSNVSDVESLIGLGLSQGAPERMLRWHYRSQHHSLIEVSNRQFYDSKLFVVPSPAKLSSSVGLFLRHITAGYYDKGGASTHREEAKAVACAVYEFAKREPHLSLGVGTFSMSQRDAVRDEIELLRMGHPEIEPFFSADREEPFFVKNLENIQGDERDVIFISIGYGKDQSGKPPTNFGPLNRDGGWRRLNVLITRARRRCEVFSSITAADIDISKTQSRGVHALREYLHYAESGDFSSKNPTGGGFESEFEEDVYGVIRSLEYEADPQVGTDGFRIDLGVKLRDRPGEYVLGVECDGATYHSSRSARDRDRLRDEILKDRGWKLHRIWSTDWFENRDREVERLRKAIAEALLDHESVSDEEPIETFIPPTIVRESVETSNGDNRLGASLYQEASLETSCLGVMNTPLEELSRTITGVVEVESPIHEDELVRRVVRLHGDQRTSAKRTECVHKALAIAARNHPIERRERFVFRKGVKVVPRDRSNSHMNLKRPDFIANEEFQAAISATVEDNEGVLIDEVAPLVAALIGLGKTSQHTRDAVEKQIEMMLASRRLIQQNRKLYAK